MTEAGNNRVSTIADRYNLAESAEWRKLLDHFELTAGGFAFIVLLVPDIDGAELCRNELEQYLAGKGKTVLRIPLEQPDDLKLLAGKLLEMKLPETTEAVWVSATSYHRLSEEEHWKAAWREGVAQLNQYRNPLRERLSATLIFTGAPWLQEVIREMAPDLWSVRTLVVNIQSQSATGDYANLQQKDLWQLRSTLDPDLALREAEKLRNHPGEELALAGLLQRAGEGLMERRQWREAADNLKQALDLETRFNGEPESKARTLNHLGAASFDLGKLGEAIGYFEQALGIARQISNQIRERSALANLGLVYARWGEPRKAIEFLEQALIVNREIEDRAAESRLLNDLGFCYRMLSEPRKAIGFCEQALSLSRRIGDRTGEADALGNIGIAYAELGELQKALEFYHQALSIHRQVGDRRGESNGLWNLALAFDQLGEREKAIASAEASLQVGDEIENVQAERVRQQLAKWRD